VFRLKHDGNGEIAKHKARIITKGFLQIASKDFIHTFSSVAKFTTHQTLLSLVAHKEWELHQVNVVAAYLQGELEDNIYLDIPDGVHEPGKENWFWKLKKPLYGLKQTGRQWKAKLNKVMKKLNFDKSQANDCLYILREGEEVVMLVLVYVNNKLWLERISS
jgi:hypothetical protein